MQPIDDDDRSNYDRDRSIADGDDGSMGSDWKEAFKGDHRDVRRFLQRIYYTRAWVLTKTVQSFAEGFREGIDEVKKRHRRD